ncbi:MAG: sulfatase [Bacteroidota bacterium]
MTTLNKQKFGLLFYGLFSIGLTILFSYNEKNAFEEQPPPNIIWIVSEDNSPYLGCYGDSLAITPNIDQLASEGMMYTHAFSNAPVCAPARNTIITGTYASGNGTENMRSTFPIDSNLIRFFPKYLREKGYYTTNKQKKDYNTIDQPSAWDESSKTAHYSNRAEGQAFFHIVNLGRSHESSIHGDRPEQLIHDPQKMNIPPYHPDTEEIRKDRAWYYDRITQMDSLVGKIISQLKADGLYDETIIFYYSDHGGILGRSKRYLYDSGQHVPFIVRVPEKYQSLFPDYKAKSASNRLISFVDLAPTMLSLAGIELPDYLDGSAFNQKSTPREYVYGYASRMDERIDMSRSIRDSQYLYIRQFFPERPNGHKLQYLFRQATLPSWLDAYEKGLCNEAQAAFWLPKDPIELFDCQADPHNVNNLYNDPDQVNLIERLNQALIEWMTAERDKGIIHELERRTFEDIKAIDQWTDTEYRSLLEFVFKATSNNQLSEPDVMAALDKNIHYQNWALHHLIKNKLSTNKELSEKISELTKSQALSVRIKAAFLLLNTGQHENGLSVFKELLNTNDEFIQLYTLDILHFAGTNTRSLFKDRIKEIAASDQKKKYDVRIAEYLLELSD